MALKRNIKAFCVYYKEVQSKQSDMRAELLTFIVFDTNLLKSPRAHLAGFELYYHYYIVVVISGWIDGVVEQP